MGNTIDKLSVNIKGITFDLMVSLLDIVNEDDKKKYQKLGYHQLLTKSEFEKHFSVDPKYIFYVPSVSNPVIYYNKETMAITEIPVLAIMKEVNKLDSKFPTIYEFIDKAETNIKNRDFIYLITLLPDAMRIEYLKMLIESDIRIDNIYQLFFTIYTSSDFGFSIVNNDFIDTIIRYKTEEERNITNEKMRKLSEDIIVYRGGNSLSVPFTEAYSWTTDINIATFFATRMGDGPAYIAQGTVKKHQVIEYIDTKEQEIVVYPQNVEIQNVIDLKDVTFLEMAIPRSSAIFSLYKERFTKLDFSSSLEEHDKLHRLRVLLLSIFLCRELQLSSEDRTIIYMTAIYYGIEYEKGISEYYSQNNLEPNPIVEFLCEYYCLPDAIGYQEIENNPELNSQADRVKFLYDLFKDADALDKIRFGWQQGGLDMSQLRLEVSKTYPLVARICYQNLEL